jgi:large exoprotein involved in heme utilization and adhesion
MGGDISIRATNLLISNGATLSTATAGSSNAGNITLEISETARIGDVNPTLSPDITGFSSILTNVEEGATGNGGRLWINAGSLEVIGSAQLASSLAGNGGLAGDIILDAGSVLIQEGIVISNIQETGNGAGGDIFITADNLIMTDGGVLDASVLGEGEAGDITLLITESAHLEGTDSDGFPTRIRSAIESGTTGTGGTISINAGELDVLAGAQLVNTVFGIGNTGNIILNIREAARFSGANPIFPNSSSGAFGSTEGNGNGGTLFITANNLEVTDNAILSTASFAAGDAADISIDLRGQLTMRNGDIKATSVKTSGASIEIIADNIRLFEDSDILTNVELGEGRGGDITLTADTIVALEDIL